MARNSLTAGGGVLEGNRKGLRGVGTLIPAPCCIKSSSEEVYDKSGVCRFLQGETMVDGFEHGMEVLGGVA
jgi:hypothetical protein